jgi:type II secretory pathway component GspD/PulD (secretin)
MKRILLVFFIGVLMILSFSRSSFSAEAAMEGKINLDLRDIDIVDALKFLAAKADVNIIVSKNVTGRINVKVKDVEIKDIFDLMLRANSLAYDEKGNIYNVMTEAEYKALYGKDFSDVRVVKVFHLDYAIPEQIFNVCDVLKSDRGRVLVDVESGVVMLMDSPAKVKEIEEAVSKFEKKNIVKVFNINYANAKDIAEQLKNQLDAKKVGSIYADERSNQVIVQTLPARMKQIKKLISQLDTKTKEVLIDTKIVKVKLSNDITESVEWEGLFNVATKHGLTYLGSYPFSAVQASADSWQSRQEVFNDVGGVGSYPFSGTTTNYSASSPKTGLEEIHLGRVTNDIDMDTMIKYFEEIGETQIVSTPQIVVANNREARIHVGEKQAYVTTTTTTGQTTSTVSEEVTFVDVGTQLFVTPTINNEGYITLKVKTEVSNVVSVLVTPSENRIPIIDTSLAETTVMTKDGTTIVIGGLRREEKTNPSTEVPVLSKIPLVGKLFTSRKPTDTRTELLIMMTPRLISGDVLVGSSQKMIGQDKIKAKIEFDETKQEEGEKVVSEKIAGLKPFK